MAISKIKREIYAGTPLSSDNCIENLWRETNQLEWLTKCGCGHWNGLTVDNDPMKMIRKEGYSCSKCGRLLNTTIGEWVMYQPSKVDMAGYHLAQPMLPYFNQDPVSWADIYKDVYGGAYTMAQVYNEKFGLSYDLGTKLISEEELKKLCVLGAIYDGPKHKIHEERRRRYVLVTAGIDWGVNPATARTVLVIGGLREDGVYEVFFQKIFKDFDYDKQIQEVANLIQRYQCNFAADSGPDPHRGIQLAKLVCGNGSNQRGQLVRYEHGNLIQHWMQPTDAVDWSQCRWCLHRTDTMTFIVKLLKANRILFPRWEDSEAGMKDILNISVEVREGLQRQEMFYVHPKDKPDDYMHALNFAVCQAYVWAQDPALLGASTSAGSENPGTN